MVAIGVSLAIGLAGCVTGYMRMVPLVLRYQVWLLLLNQVWLSGGVIRFIRVSRTQVCYPEGPAGDVVSGVDPVCFNPSVLRPQSLIVPIYLLTGPVIPVTQPFILVSPFLVDFIPSEHYWLVPVEGLATRM